jgi:membrane protein DedA with SNARE-associated domain
MPFAIGISRVPVLRFVGLNVLGALAWALVFSGGGYLCGNVLEQLLGHIRHYEKILFIMVAVTGGAVWAYYLYRRNLQKSRAATDTADKAQT